MKLKRLKNFIRSQKGVTLIELLVVIVVSGVLGFALVQTIYQIFSGNNAASNQLLVTDQVNKSITWINRDAMMAQTIIMDTDTALGLPLIMQWTDWDADQVNRVTYSLSSNGDLKRLLVINGEVKSDTVIGRYIVSDGAKTHCQFANNTLTFKITSEQAGIQPASATRLVTILPKSGY